MEPPRHVCESLKKIHPYLRFAWHGPRKQFAVVQLFHIQNAGTVDDPNTFWHRWDDGYGPVFSASGRPGFRDWDALSRAPMFMAMAEDLGRCTNEDVYSGKILKVIKDCLHFSKKDKIRKRQSMNKDMERRMDDLNEEMADYLWFQAGKTGSTGVDVPWDFARDDYARQIRKGEVASEYLNHYYDVPGM